MKRILSLVITIAIIIIALPVSANDGSLGRMGESVHPLGDNDIEMVSENIVLTMDDMGDVFVSCTFNFHNTGDDKTVLMGFPAVMTLDEWAMGDPENAKLKNFTAFRNGVEIEVLEEAGISVESQYAEYDSWFTFEVAFAADETLVMTHTYEISPPGWSTGDFMLSYILKTGATWKNNIGHSVVTFEIPQMNPYSVYYIGSDWERLSDLSSFRYSDGNLIFEKFDFKPEHNIELILTWYGKIGHHLIDELRREEQWESVEFFEAAKNMNEDELIEAYNNLSYEEKTIETIYLNTRIGLPVDSQIPVCSEIYYSDDYRAIVAVVEDRDFDSEYTIDYRLLHSNGQVAKSGELAYWQLFGDYGEVMYFVQDDLNETWNDSQRLEITATDKAGNSSVTVFNRDGVILSQTTSDASDKIENPKTSESMNYLGFAILFLVCGIALIGFQFPEDKPGLKQSLQMMLRMK